MSQGYHRIPDKGDQVEQRQSGVSRVGTVWYADRLQVLVKWQDGSSGSLRLGRDHFTIRRTAEARTGRRRDASDLGASNGPYPGSLDHLLETHGESAEASDVL